MENKNLFLVTVQASEIIGLNPETFKNIVLNVKLFTVNQVEEHREGCTGREKAHTQ